MSNGSGGKDVFLDTDNSINAAIRKIRQVLRDDPEQPRFVQTLTGRGYRFIAPVDEVGPPAVSSAETPVGGGLIGKKISHYRILQVLGGGGMGAVYKAEDLKLGRRVALKFLPSELASDPKALDRMQREACAASALDHPNICAIYELGDHDGQPFLVMQLLEGQTLREWIESIPASSEASRLREIVRFGTQIADGLDAAQLLGTQPIRSCHPQHIKLLSTPQGPVRTWTSTREARPSRSTPRSSRSLRRLLSWRPTRSRGSSR